VLLRGAKDPGTLLVKTVKTASVDAAPDHGAIKGLLPHGPHNLRDILGPHILKQTASYRHVSYATQNMPDVVRQHYGRVLPQDKAALCAKILIHGWEAAWRSIIVRCESKTASDGE
jgi:hypothetical protein